MTGHSSPAIFGFPVELAQHILSYCHPWDVAAFSRTCRAAFVLVYLPTDQYLWRQLYAAFFDRPRWISDPFSEKEKVDWRNELTNRLKIEIALFRGPATLIERRHSLEMLITIIEDSSWAISHTGSSLNIGWLRTILNDSLLLTNLYSIPDSEEYFPLGARVRAYLALTVEYDSSKRDKSTLALLLNRRDMSRAYVYDLRNCKAENEWGPFKPDGSVNWVHVEHIIDVVSLNIRELPGSWALTKPPSCLGPLNSSFPTHTTSPTSVDDWAGVEGTWRRYVCFMDYRDLFAFNFTDLADGPRHPKFFKDPRFREATRLIEVKLKLISFDKMRFHRLPELFSSKNVLPPPLCFTGFSKAVNGNEAAVEGFVFMGKDGIIRWQLTSIYDGHAQWSSSGVQIGGVKSPMGVAGVWTTTHHDQDDPVGPFWLWKVDDDSPAHLMEFT